MNSFVIKLIFIIIMATACSIDLHQYIKAKVWACLYGAILSAALILYVVNM